MPNVELIYDADCPNVESAREQLRQAFQDVGRPVEWSEWDRADPHSPAHVRRFGSPTILVDGQDVAGVAPSDGAPCCRVYRDDGGKFRGVPSVKSIAVSLTGGKRAGSRSWLASVPAALVAVLPNLTCPACWPAYAGLLSALGLPFVNYTPLLTPLMMAALAIAVGTLAVRAKSRRGYGPFIAGFVAAAAIVVGRFVAGWDAITYAGIALLISASLWNSWPRRTSNKTTCPACATAGPLMFQPSKGRKLEKSERGPSSTFDF